MATFASHTYKPRAIQAMTGQAIPQLPSERLNKRQCAGPIFRRVRKHFSAKVRYLPMPDNADEFRRAAAECLELAQNASDENARAALLAMAQKWLDLASDPFGARRFSELLRELNDQQMLDTPKQ
jgi:hypothetical protein